VTVTRVGEVHARRAATEYMRDKGFPDARPFAVQRVSPAQTAWLFSYQLDGAAQLQLRITWDPAEAWDWYVTWFQRAARHQLTDADADT